MAMSQTTPQPAGPAINADSVARFLRNYYIYFVLVAVVAVLSVANLDQFDLFERGNFLNKRNIINILYYI